MIENNEVNTVDNPKIGGVRLPYNLSAAKAQATIVRTVISSLDAQVRKSIKKSDVKRLENIFIIGCGDSFFAGVAARLAFDKYSGIRTEPVESLEFSRYVIDFIPQNSLVFAISYSGQVSRTREGVILAKQRGIPTFAITGYGDSPLAREADVALIQGLPKDNEIYNNYDEWHHVGMGNFIVSLLALYLIAFRIGELLGKITGSEAKDLKQELLDSSEIILNTSLENIRYAQEIAANFYNYNDFIFIGGGPSYGSAMFSAGKVLEQPNLNGVPSELEEWAHLQYFLVRPKSSPVFVVAPPGRSHDRALEQIRGIRGMGGIAIAVCDAADKEIIKLADYIMPIMGSVREEFSPLVYIIPAQLFATALHQIRGLPPLFPPFDLPKQEEVNHRQIRESQMRKTLE